MSSAPAGPSPLTSRAIFVLVRLFAAGLVAIVVLSLIGTVWWRLTPTRDLDVFVYDQTVANDSYPDHAVLEQLLEYHRVPYDAEDYVGASPGGGPYGSWPSEQPDLIVLADLYGIYTDDEGQISDVGSNRITDRITPGQAEDIQRWISQGTPAYAEFGLLTEPTPTAAGQVLGAAFGFETTKWAIKPYDALEDVSPQIASLAPQPWRYEGPGWIIVSLPTAAEPDGGDLIVLPESLLNEPLPRIVGGPPGSAGGSAPFAGWIGVIEPLPGSSVDAWAELDVTDEAVQLLEAAGVPLRFPALVRTERTLYFAGDGLDDETPFRLNRTKGGAFVTRLLTGDEFRFLYQVLEPSVGWLLQQHQP